MIKINLLTVERAKKKAPFQFAQRLTLGCSLILILAVLFVGWRFLSLTKESARLDSEIAAAEQETTRLRSILAQVQQFEQRKTQLQQRVTLIEQLRKEQADPVHMLDQISRALPPMLWLTQLKQSPSSSEVVIDGRCTTLTDLSDFVTNLEASGYFRRSVEIVSSQTEALAVPPGELIKFSIKAQFQQPGDAVKAVAAESAKRGG